MIQTRDPKMLHADILVCDGDQQEAGQFFSECDEFKLCRAASNVPTSIFIDKHHLNRNGRWYGLDVAHYHIIHIVATQ